MRSRRFKVRSLTGWRITPSTGRVGTRFPSTEWYVLDSVYCYQIVGRFAGWEGERSARKLARELNRKDARCRA